MTLTLATIAALGAAGATAGCLGAIIGIGGGVLLVPVLVLLFHVDMRVAVATSLVSVVATSTAAGSVYVGAGLANMRLGMTLEIATTIGGVLGGMMALFVPPGALAAAFAGIVALTAVLLVARGGGDHGEARAENENADEEAGWERRGALAGAYYDHHRGALVEYAAHRVLLGSAIALVAGSVSGMLGVGGGFLKVPAMTLGMRVPVRVAAATSNFMIGVTAISSLFVYFARGFVHPLLAAPVALGVIGGSIAGTALAVRVAPRVLRWVLAFVLAGVSVEMVIRAVGAFHGR